MKLLYVNVILVLDGKNMNDWQLILLIIFITFIIAIVLFILSGFFRVKKNYVAIFEKMYAFYDVKEQGMYFFTPFIVRRVGYYQKEIQYIRINLLNDDVYIKYQVEDFKMFHYQGHNFNQVIVDELKKVSNDISQVVYDVSQKYGIKIIDLKIINKA